MNRRNKLVLVITALLFALWILAQYNSENAETWQPDYRSKSKSAYGCYVLYDNLGHLFPGQKVSQLYQGFVSAKLPVDSAANVIIITNSFISDSYDVKAMLGFVAGGNNVFIAADYFPQCLKDTLGFETKTDFGYLVKPNDTVNEIFLDFVPAYIGRFKVALSHNRFVNFNDSVQVLGFDQKKQTNFVAYKVGKGMLYLHCEPKAFSNYGILYGDARYAFVALSVLPTQPVVWCNFYKPGSENTGSPMRFILAEPPLRYAYYMVLFGVLVYFLVESKRKQRIVPVVEPMQNLSWQLAQAVGKLYFRNGNHADLAHKLAVYFKEFLKEKYYLRVVDLSPDTIQSLAAKTGLPEVEVERVLKTIMVFEKRKIVSEPELMNFSRQIDDFKLKCNN